MTGSGKREDGFDVCIREALNRKADTLKPSSEDAGRMCAVIHERIKEEEKMTRRWSIKKAAAAAAAVCALGTITAVAAGKATQSISHSDLREEVREYSKAEELRDRLGENVKMPETFSNGYSFLAAVPSHDQGLDEEGNVVAQGENLNVVYGKEGMADVNLDIQITPVYGEAAAGETAAGEMAAGEAAFGEVASGDLVFRHGDVVLSYSCDQYLFLPPDQKPSEEDQAREAAGELYISYGSSEEQRKESSYITWSDDGMIYMLLSFDNTMTPEEFAGMAGEIIDMHQ